MVVIGRAENLAFCEATKADGNRCGKWVDACVRGSSPCRFPHYALTTIDAGGRAGPASSMSSWRSSGPECDVLKPCPSTSGREQASLSFHR